MKRLLTGLVLGCLMASPALAALKQGDKAPDFTAPASLGGKVAYEYTSLDPSKHVTNTMDAVKALDAH